MVRKLTALLPAITFVILVLAPSLCATIYMYMFASDQYHSRVAFSVRSLDSSPTQDLLGGVIAAAGGSGGEDALLLYDFIQSEQMVSALDEGDLFTSVYNNKDGDYLFSLGENKSLEEKTFFWNIYTQISYNNTSHVLEIVTYAFSAEDARKITSRVAEESTKLINEISEKARNDAVSFSEDAVKDAEDQLRIVRQALRDHRRRTGKIEQDDAITVLERRIGEFEQSLDAERTQLQVMRNGGLDQNSPAVRVKRRMIEALEKTITTMRNRIKGNVGDRGDLVDDIATEEELKVELGFAQTSYTNALAALTQARAEARRSQRYLAIHISPTKAESSVYPSRFLLSLAVFGACFMLWSISRTIIASIYARF